MAEIAYLISGAALLLFVSYDFFYTTLSASGAAPLARGVSFMLQGLLLLLVRIFGRKAFSISGMLINLAVLTLWILLIWLGLFLVFSYHPEAIINSNGKVASTIERFYYTGYVLSTLGLGNFKPTTPFFEILTSGFSLFGFVFITTSMTYLVSVSSAVMHKRTLGLFIRNLGKRPDEVARYLLGVDSSFRYQQLIVLQQMIDRHSTNHQAYPVLHFYHTPTEGTSLSINLTVLDEAVSILLNSNKLNNIEKELQPLRNSISNFLQHVEQKYGHKADAAPSINWSRLQLPEGVPESENTVEHPLRSRRKVLQSLLQSENWNWDKIYPESALNNAD